MPTIRKNPGEAVQCIESHCFGGLPGSPIFLAGATLRRDHPAVQANPQFFTTADATTDEVQALRHALYADEPSPLQPIVRAEPKPPLLDRDAVVIGPAQLPGIAAGQRISKNAEIVKAHPDAFVPVLPKGLDRSTALRAPQMMTRINADDTTTTVYAGQLVAPDDPFVALHRLLFERPHFEA